MPGNNCFLPFCLEDWGIIGFGLFTAILLPIVLVVYFALFVRCRYCFNNRGSKGIRFAFKSRRRAMTARVFLGTRVMWMQQHRQGHTRTNHWDQSGRYMGSSNSTHDWQESVPVNVNVYEYFYECPDCGSTWSRIRQSILYEMEGLKHQHNRSRCDKSCKVEFRS